MSRRTVTGGESVQWEGFRMEFGDWVCMREAGRGSAVGGERKAVSSGGNWNGRRTCPRICFKRHLDPLARDLPSACCVSFLGLRRATINV